MAQTLPDFDFDDRSNRSTRPESYPWDRWLDGRVWELTFDPDGQGDFESKPDVFRNTVGAAAKRRNLKTKTHCRPNKNLVIMAYKPEDGEPDDSLTDEV